MDVRHRAANSCTTLSSAKYMYNRQVRDFSVALSSGCYMKRLPGNNQFEVFILNGYFINHGFFPSILQVTVYMDYQ